MEYLFSEINGPLCQPGCRESTHCRKLAQLQLGRRREQAIPASIGEKTTPNTHLMKMFPIQLKSTHRKGR